MKGFDAFRLDPANRCDQAGVPEHRGERTKTDGTEPAKHPTRESVQVSVGRDGAVIPEVGYLPRSFNDQAAVHFLRLSFGLLAPEKLCAGGRGVPRMFRQLALCRAYAPRWLPSTLLPRGARAPFCFFRSSDVERPSTTSALTRRNPS